MTYERLWARPELQIDLLITLGCAPRAARHRVPKLHPARTREGALAAGVRRWINIADPGDSSLSRPASPATSRVSTPTLTAPIGVFDTHKVTGYLARTTAAGALATLLGR
jgi:hypothetical protein